MTKKETIMNKRYVLLLTGTIAPDVFGRSDDVKKST